MKIVKFLLPLVALFFAGQVLAHVHLTQTVPADKAMLTQTPDTLILNFSGPVRLTKISLTDADNTSVEFGFTPSASASEQFSWALPVLQSGNYQVSWIALGADGHKMSGDFSFMLHGPSASATAVASPHSHQH
ncbi:MAG: copper resistance protein CopC [Rheinheimera sp.]|uniref:copper resistance CopC family protein n=1 Tax=unclassified Arsukibacterium TaxID=2635278 RepID=UPI000C35E162|nr:MULTISPECIES: copper resistance CopC family protein [unclassified Arsukibacterium]MBM34852.1 copper resistance protein CopC [Rheinheimera sp.]HAW93643.1 copper resistance protein CopC [Candidatus Azambacteria bacterium]|tara:strand:- start:976 stop:1374 length:399 start_codon:yes stop_codon:yes gene_type:complete